MMCATLLAAEAPGVTESQWAEPLLKAEAHRVAACVTASPSAATLVPRVWRQPSTTRGSQREW